MSTNSKCCYCGTSDKELRPYGPQGKYLCFECMTETPDRERAATQEFNRRLSATGGAALLTEEGPIPYIGPISIKLGVKA